jgi:hypothetical protein
MIRINLDGVSSNAFSRIEAKMMIAGRLESLGYFDNPWQMNVGVPRCPYVQKQIERRMGGKC